MTKKVLLQTGASLVYFFYPFLIYLGLKELQPLWFALFLVLLVGLRLSVWPSEKKLGFCWITVALVVLCITYATGSSIGLYLYPVLVSLLFFMVFFISLYRPPPIVERIARRIHTNLSPAAIQYTRTVNKVWCTFFFLNAICSYFSLQISEQWWLLYNGFISYCFMGVLFTSEYVVRQHVMRRHDA